MLGRSPLFWTCLCLGWLSHGCGGDPVDPLSEDGNGLGISREPFVEDFEPASAIQGSLVALHVHGQNFDEGSRVDLLLSGAVIGEVQTLSTVFVTPEELVANISVADNAPVGSYEVQVTTSGGKRGIPIEDFTVLADSLRAVKLEFTTDPGPALSGLWFSTPIQVTARTSDGQTDTGFAGTVTIALLGNPGGPSLMGTTSSKAIRGVATFYGDLSIQVPGYGYRLTATATGVNPGTSAGFDVLTAGRIAFVSDREGTPKIYVMNADGSGVTRLTDGADADSRPAWSPDGRRIAFARGPDRRWFWSAEDNGTCGIYVMSADGSGLTRLTTDCADGHPTWSPDGARIAFRKWTPEGSGNGLYVMNADGSGIARLTWLTEAGLDQYPAWSPDGQRIAFTRSLDLDGELPHLIYVMNADNSAISQLTSSDPQGYFAESCPAWSPDGSSIVFWSFGYGIATIHSFGGIPSRVYKGVGGLGSFGYVNFYSNPDWSPDGQKVVFAREPDLSSFLGLRKLRITDASGAGSLQPITTFSTAGEDYEPAWSRVSQ